MHYDIVILGAGINGCGLARRLSSPERSVLVVERATVGAGTSSRSSKLIHGGLRYLENMEFSLVREALHDRTKLLQLFPELVKLVPFYLPVYEDSPRAAKLIRFGLRVYDLLAGKPAGHRSAVVPFEEFAKNFPAVRREGLQMVLRYHDALTDDVALTRAVAEQARERGAVFLEGVEPEDLVLSDRVIEVRLPGRTVTTTTLINATGPWIGEVNARYRLPSRYQVTRVSGIHLYVPGALVPWPLFLQTASQRIFFIIPRGGETMIGTTERFEKSTCDEVMVSEEDVDYLLENARRYLRVPLLRQDITRVELGIRPLIEQRDDPTRISREYRFDLHLLGRVRLLHVFGGKLTTFLSLADKAARLLRRAG
ncbi:MAG: hypothetical protein A2284_04045 [Deltaproteobacteria bacterium RIFOXYA12_FULL_61_11]|nr:MAG: hypothetical protein A2284_04045 [Deltaproteobacteria bacterium RIFOXYA12_FULL_61_11]